ncbi:hypothetical protein ABZT02_10950 [Streptomyces sp. NPDC005402]|uniref:hypothetical protein n=1 Tax=Streptomyces sp. NPDC005402 TaxID=3155338 RepID=UPI0033A2439D
MGIFSLASPTPLLLPLKFSPRSLLRSAPLIVGIDRVGTSTLLITCSKVSSDTA